MSSYLIHFVFAAKMPFEHFVSLSVDNYLAMEVACTLVCPRANQEVIITHSDGNETQKCEKCEGDCPKGGYSWVFVSTCACEHNVMFTCIQWHLFLLSSALVFHSPYTPPGSAWSRNML